MANECNGAMTLRVFDLKAPQQAASEVGWDNAVSFAVVGIDHTLSVEDARSGSHCQRPRHRIMALKTGACGYS